ncbi:MAG: tetratricopeptide repeat protein [Myxococcota bacterium]|nr:tetratricopeptide repeat protein [Myxococcota bacterium]
MMHQRFISRCQLVCFALGVAFLVSFGQESHACCPQSEERVVKNVWLQKTGGLVWVGSEEENTWAGKEFLFEIVDRDGKSLHKFRLSENLELDINQQEGEKIPREARAFIDKIKKYVNKSPSKKKKAEKKRRTIQEVRALIASFAKPVSLSSRCPFRMRKTKRKATIVYHDKKLEHSIPTVSSNSGCVKDDLFTEDTPAMVCHQMSLGQCYQLADDDWLIVKKEHINRQLHCLTTDFERPYRINQDSLRPYRENISGFRELTAGRLKEAEQHFRKSLEADAGHVHANFNLACTLARQKRPMKTGLPYLERLLSNPKQRKEYLRKVSTDEDLEAWRQTGLAEWAQAVKIIRPKKKITLPAARVAAMKLNEKGFLAYRKKKYAEAIQLFQEASQTDSDYFIAKTNLASTLALIGRTDEALSALMQAHELNPSLTVKKMKMDKDYDRIRNTAVFKSLLEDE